MHPSIVVPVTVEPISTNESGIDLRARKIYRPSSARVAVDDVTNRVIVCCSADRSLEVLGTGVFVVRTIRRFVEGVAGTTHSHGKRHAEATQPE